MFWQTWIISLSHSEWISRSSCFSVTSSSQYPLLPGHDYSQNISCSQFFPDIVSFSTESESPSEYINLTITLLHQTPPLVSVTRSITYDNLPMATMYEDAPPDLLAYLHHLALALSVSAAFSVILWMHQANSDVRVLSLLSSSLFPNTGMAPIHT